MTDGGTDVGHTLVILEDGAEASFLVLRENPLERLDHIRDIKLRIKDGKLLGTSDRL